MLIIAAPEAGATRDANYRLDETQRFAQQEHLARLAAFERYPGIHFANADRLAVGVMRSGLHEILASARGVRRLLKTAPKPREANRRYLRGYAFDPHVQMDLEPGEANEIAFSVPRESLYPGPCGDLIDVIDHDPASGCFYEPVDLEHPALLTQDGLAPSEANPKFHQQMVYAVAMSTIEVFEQALGRRVLWSGRPEPGPDAFYFVRTLRIYPHALRAPKAYYDPERKAILFGYYPVGADFSPQNLYPDGVVFTCLSPQTIAGEMAHALVSELFPTLRRADSRDMLAFTLAIADIVALLQHFSMPGVLRHAFGRPGAGRSLGAALGELAMQLGAAGDRSQRIARCHRGCTTRQRRGGGGAPDAIAFVQAQEATDRGAIVVAAIFDAYVSIVERRSADVRRDLASEFDAAGDAALPAELVELLEDEAAKAARHLLAMCVRALDYCPPVDVDAGDFLRALITADIQAMPQDTLGYRAAVVDAFRAHGIHPLGFRSLSVEMLPFDPPGETASRLLRPLIGARLGLWADRLAVLDDMPADGRFALLHNWSRDLHEPLTDLLQSLQGADREALASALGLDPSIDARSLKVFPPRVTTRTTLGGGRAFISLVQDRDEAGDVERRPASVRLCGGSTIVVKFGTWDIEHIVCRSIRAR